MCIDGYCKIPWTPLPPELSRGRGVHVFLNPSEIVKSSVMKLKLSRTVTLGGQKLPTQWSRNNRFYLLHARAYASIAFGDMSGTSAMCTYVLKK